MILTQTPDHQTPSATPRWAGESSRRIIKRIVVTAELTLLTPAHIGNGDSDDLTDMPLFVAPDDGVTPLLTGASIAGALRTYLRERENGYGQEDHKSSAAVLLLGGLRQDPDGEQSPLIVDDAYGESGGVTVRDGVMLDGRSRTANDKTKFDVQLWQAGTKFPLRFELLIRGGAHPDDESRLCQALATALNGFHDELGSITLGARKRRGYGRVQVSKWRVRIFDLQTADGLRDWVLKGGQDLSGPALSFSQVMQPLGVANLDYDRREIFEMKAEFTLDGSLLIRSIGDWGYKGPDDVHLRARQCNGKDQKDQEDQAVLSGTSLGGALKARACKIANTVRQNQANAALIENLFGQTSHASRLEVREDLIEGGITDLVQNRVSIDRFTGGAREGALFNQQPVFGDDKTRICITCRLRIAPDDEQAKAEIGLLLHLLKDLWTSDLTLGGESSVGRGRLQGQCATLTWRRDGTPRIWKIERTNAGLSVSGTIREGDAITDQSQAEARAALEEFTAAFWKLLRPVEAKAKVENAAPN